jgi:hypothetical protein
VNAADEAVLFWQMPVVMIDPIMQTFRTHLATGPNVELRKINNASTAELINQLLV